MLNTRCLTHKDKKPFLIYADTAEVAEQWLLTQGYPHSQTHPFTMCMQILESWKNKRLKELSRQGIDEETLTDEMLWLDVEWPAIRRNALRLVSASTLQKIFPKVVSAGFAQSRYVKRYRSQRVCDSEGRELFWATYEEAQRDSSHPGRIIHQAFFESSAVARAIESLVDTPVLDPPKKPKRTKREGAQRDTQATKPDIAEHPSSKECNSNKVRGGKSIDNEARNSSAHTIAYSSPISEGVNTTVGQISHFAPDEKRGGVSW